MLRSVPPVVFLKPRQIDVVDQMDLLPVARAQAAAAVVLDLGPCFSGVYPKIRVSSHNALR